jgi:hypothetical protein
MQPILPSTKKVGLIHKKQNKADSNPVNDQSYKQFMGVNYTCNINLPVQGSVF